MRALLLIYSVATASKETKIVLVVMALILLLPVIALMIIANAGLSAVSDAIATVDPVSHLVEIFNPNGKPRSELQVSTVWPVHGFISLEFGESDAPYQVHHTGIDIADKIGDPITTFMTGRVLVSNANPSNPTGYGEYVEIDHGNGITSIYGHMSQVIAKVGGEVKPGNIIGLEGVTGHTTGPHVHFEIRVDDIPVNPRIFMIGNPQR